jgi:hypothetical protein
LGEERGCETRLVSCLLANLNKLVLSKANPSNSKLPGDSLQNSTLLSSLKLRRHCTSLHNHLELSLKMVCSQSSRLDQTILISGIDFNRHRLRPLKLRLLARWSKFPGRICSESSREWGHLHRRPNEIRSGIGLREDHHLEASEARLQQEDINGRSQHRYRHLRLTARRSTPHQQSKRRGKQLETDL